MLEVLKDNRDICQIPDNELNTIICKCIINVRQRDGSKYEPNKVKGIVASIGRHLRSNNYGNSMKKRDAFDQARRVLTAKTMDLKKWERVTNQIKPNHSQMTRWINCIPEGRWGCIIQMHY
jgi:hypothetical protein